MRPNRPSRDELAGAMTDGGKAENVNFIGKKAVKGFERFLAEEAARLRRQGVDKQKILEDTGMFAQSARTSPGAGPMPGGGVNWKTEIPGSQSVVKPDVADIFDKRFFGSFNETLGSSLDYPDLFAAYPDLEHLGVNIKNLTPGTETGGHYNELYDFFDQNEAMAKQGHFPGIEARAVDIGGLRRILLHEIQHAIQKREGWPRGGSWTDPQAVDWATEVRRKSKPMYESLERMANTAPDFTMWELENPEMAHLLDQHRRVQNPPSNWSSDFQGYRFLEGENEAYNAEHRGGKLNLPPEQLRLLHPDKTAMFPSSVTWRK